MQIQIFNFSKFYFLANNISLLFTGYILQLDSFFFSDLARSKDNVKRALLQFQIQLKKSGRSDIYSLPVFLGFSLREKTFVPRLLYQPIYSINPVRPGFLGGIKTRGRGSTKNHTFENPLLIVKML